MELGCEKRVSTQMMSSCGCAQYRILEAKTQTGSDELKTVFESHLAEAGRMLLLLDSFVNPAYIKRAWCIFEAYVCIDNNFPMTIILPERAESTSSAALILSKYFRAYTRQPARGPLDGKGS